MNKRKRILGLRLGKNCLKQNLFSKELRPVLVLIAYRLRILIALLSYKAKRLPIALEQALYIAHTHRHIQPSSRILILPNWQHSPYLARNLHSYTQKLASIPYLKSQNTHKNTHTSRLNIYLVANEKALRLLDHDYVTHTLHETMSRVLDQDT
jgi:hypothetical protein